MIVIAFAAHLLLLAVAVLMGEFSVRPETPVEAYTVEIVDDGELGGHMPAGLPKLDLGGEPPKQVAKRPPPAKQPEPPPPPPPPPPAPEEPAEEPVEEPPPPEEKKPQPELAKEEPKPEPAVDPKPPEEGDLVVATATPAPTATVAPTAKPTAKPTVKPTARPTPKPTPATTASPRPTAKPPAAATASPRPSATPKATATPVKSPRSGPARSPGAAPKPTQSSVVVVKGRPTPPAENALPAGERAPQGSPQSERDARIAEALARVQRSIGSDRGAAAGAPGDAGVRAPGADARGTGGVGGTDAPDPSRRVGIGPGRGGAGALRGAEFLLYYNAMLARIREAWVYTGGATTAEVKVRFRILDDGVVTELRVTQPSGDAAYDASVLRAVRGASPLGAPPEKHRADFADVELTFQPGDLKAAP